MSINDNGCVIFEFINGILYEGIIYRTITEVTLERMKVAELFANSDDDSEVVVQNLKQSFLSFFLDEKKLSDNVRLQLKINIFNKVTAEQVLKEYNKN